MHVIEVNDEELALIIWGLGVATDEYAGVRRDAVAAEQLRERLKAIRGK
jgi:hypothetical protein